MSAAIAAGDEEPIRRLYAMVDDTPPGLVPVYLHGQHLRFRALLAHLVTTDVDVDATFVAATKVMTDFGAPFWTGRILLEHAEWLEGQGRPDDQDTGQGDHRAEDRSAHEVVTAELA